MSTKAERSTGPILVCVCMFVVLRTFLSWGPMSQLPPPSDQLQYLTPILFGNTEYDVPSFQNIPMARSGLPWFDRLSFFLKLRFATYVPAATKFVAPIYAYTSAIIVLVVGLVWAYRKTNLVGAVFFGVLYNTAYSVNVIGVEAVPEGILTLCSLGAFVFMFPAKGQRRPVAAGMFASLAAFSKAPGVVVPMALIGSMVWRRDKPADVLRFVKGMVLGVVAVTGTFAVVFGWGELFQTVHGFMFGTLDRTLQGRKSVNNFVSYVEPFFRLQYLPVFAVLFLCPRAMKDTRSRPPFLMAWAFVGVIYFCYYASSRGYVPKMRYMYPAGVFAMLALSVHAGVLFEQTKARFRDSDFYWLMGAVLLLLVSGAYLSSDTNPRILFDARDIGNFPRLLGAFYGVGAAMSLVALMVLEVRGNARTVVATLLFFSVWLAAVPTAVAYHDAIPRRARVMWFYDNSRLLGKLEQEFGVRSADLYIKEWSNVKWAYRLPWVYHVMDESRVERSYAPGAEHEKADFHVFTSAEKFKKKGRRHVVVTDVADEVENLVSVPVQLKGELEWKNLKLVIVQQEEKGKGET